MTVEQMISALDSYTPIVLIYLGASPLLSLLLRLLHGRGGGEQSPWKYFYSALIYLACVPGIVSLVLTLYSLLFIRANLLNLNVSFYYLPVLSMFLTLIIIRKSVTFDAIPGFKKLYGLFSLILISFLVVFILDRLRIFIFFRGSILAFLGVWVVIFIALKYATRLLFGRFKRKD